MQIVDGYSSEASDDCDIKRLSHGDSFDGRSQRSRTNSIAGMSRGSKNSQGSRGIRNFLGDKFKKRAESIKKQESGNTLGKSQRLGGGSSALMMPGQSGPMGKLGSKPEFGTAAIMEDIDSDISGDFSADLNYNYDVINLKEEGNPF